MKQQAAVHVTTVVVTETEAVAEVMINDITTYWVSGSSNGIYQWTQHKAGVNQPSKTTGWPARHQLCADEPASDVFNLLIWKVCPKPPLPKHKIKSKKQKNSLWLMLMENNSKENSWRLMLMADADGKSKGNSICHVTTVVVTGTETAAISWNVT